MAGGDRLFVCFPPAEGSLPVGERQLRCGGRSSEDRLRLVAQLREENVGRRRGHCAGLYSGEAAVVGGNTLFGCSPPAGNRLIEGKRLRSRSYTFVFLYPAQKVFVGLGQ